MLKDKRNQFSEKARIVLLFSFLFVHGNLFAQDYFPMNLGNTWIYNQLDTNGNITGKDSMVINDNYTVLNLDIFLGIKYYTPPFIFSDSDLVPFFNDTQLCVASRYVLF